MSSQGIWAGFPQGVVVFPPDQKAVDIGQANQEKVKKESNWQYVDAAPSEPTHTINALPELKALDPDMVSEELKKQRKVRNRIH
ncbi:CIC11C00000002007 [Sungouiella intermedia]|uniref:CIC11C00000002007 n=1 Tax=Sungouiella intermedia TaxID=45354 RepID=A0A1L0FW93_9ASCO|nr:CIC11C00000002007 [[Candida] intermedia]